jgi:hypothetical protein
MLAIPAPTSDAASALERFDGIHLDLEPWVNTGTDFSWVDDLIADYQYASSVLEGSGLILAADISGVKVINDMIDPQKRQALLDAATRLVLMEYQEPSVDRINRSAQATVASFVHDHHNRPGRIVGIAANVFSTFSSTASVERTPAAR